MIYEYGQDTWSEYLAARATGRVVEIGPDMYDYWLEVLPPVGWTARGFLFAEGSETPIEFWSEGGQSSARHYCQRTG